LTCEYGKWVADTEHPTTKVTCVKMLCDTGGLSQGSDWACRSGGSGAWKGQSQEPEYGDQCKRSCDSSSPYYQVCNVSESNLNGFPKMITYSGDSCHAEITTKAPTTTVLETTAVPTTQSPAETTYIAHTVELTGDWGNKTSDALMADTGLMESLKSSLAAGVIAASPDLAGITKDDIIIKDLTVTTVRRLSQGAASSRRLASSKLSVDYAIAVPASKAATASTIGAAITSNTAAFNTAMATSYKAAEKARTGVEPVVEVKASSVVAVETPAPPTPKPTPAPPTPKPTPRPTPRPTPSPTSSPTPSVTSAPSGTTAAAEEEEDGGSGAIIGGVIGGVGGIGLLGFLFYMYKKKSAQE